MAIEFVLWNHRFPLHKQAYDYLSEACKRARLSIITPEHTIEQARKDLCLIYQVIDTNEIIGCFTLCFRTTDNDYYLELPLLAGKRLMEWRDFLVEFLFKIAADNNCTKFTMIGRKGFERLFPELSLLCCVYGRNLT